MSEKQNSKYSYHEMSNKVEMADRSLLRKRANEPTGEVETLGGRMGIGRMGDRVEVDKKVGSQRSSRQREVDGSSSSKRQKHGVDEKARSFSAPTAGKSIVDLNNVTGYVPGTLKARKAYETMLVSLIR